MQKVACIGMAAVDLIIGPVEQFSFRQDVTLVDAISVKAGGDAGNVALNLTALGVPVSLYTKLGTDMFGNWLFDHYCEHGVGTGYVRRTDSESTGIAVALVNHKGDRVFLYRGGTVDTLCLDDIDVPSVLSHDMLHSSGFYLLPSLQSDGLAEIFQQAHQNGLRTSLDVGWDETGNWFETIVPMLPHLTYFLPTLNEAMEISGCESIEDCATFFIDHGVENAVIKAGSLGAYVNDGQQAFWVEPSFVRKVVDTTGAGDGFVSGFLSAISRGYSIRDAVKVGNNAGAVVVQQYGSTGAIRDFEQIDLGGFQREKTV